MEEQEPYVKAAVRLRQLIDLAPGHFGNLRIEPDKKRVLVFWKGSVPIEVLAAAQNRLEGVAIEFVQSPYDAVELQAEVTRLLSVQFNEGEVVIAAPRTDASGIDLTFRPSAPDQKAPTDLSRYPVTVEYSGAPVNLAARWDDAPPWYGGANIRGGSGGPCTSGFAVNSNSDLKPYILTAKHCGITANWTDAKGQYMGPTHSYDPTRDAQIISVIQSSQRIYTGGADESGTGLNESNIYISGRRFTPNNTKVCTSGSYTGQKCYITVRNDNTSYKDSTGVQIGNALDAQADSPGNIAGSGDSGGPVWSGAGTNVAAGIILAGKLGYEVACTGIQASLRQCFSRFYYGNIQDTLDALHVDVPGGAQ